MDETKYSQELKLYMPLTVQTWYEENVYDEIEELCEPYEINSSVLVGHVEKLTQRIENYANPRDFSPEFEDKGLMAYFESDYNSALAEKVTRLDFTFEEVDGEVYGVAKCQLTESLQPSELTELKEYVTGQASDGLGEGFEQQDIPLDEIEINVTLWNFDDWSLKTAEEMGFDEPEQEMTGIT